MVRTPDLAQKTHLSRIPVLGFTLFCKYLSESLRALALLGDNSSSETLLVLAVLFLAGSATFACFTLGIVLEWRLNQSEMCGVYQNEDLSRLIWLTKIGARIWSIRHQRLGVKKVSVVRARKDYLYWPVTLSDGQALKGKDE